MIEIDGEKGGGQILRTACALSAVTKKPCHVFNIRKNRPRPGLAFQHLLGIRALAELCNGKLEGDELASEEIWLEPGEIRSRDLKIKIETAGSITLVLQTLILPCLFTSFPVKIIFDGGATDTFFSPTMNYFRYVFLKILEKVMSQKVAEVEVKKRGFYPEGGAEVEVKIYPTKLKFFNLTERGKLKKILVISGSSESLKKKKVAERQIAGVKEILGKLKLPIEEKIEYYQTQSPGSQICLISQFENTVIGADNLGKLGKSAEEVGKECALSFLKEEKSGAPLDKFLSDQILPYLALAEGKSQVRVSQITDHAKTNIWVIEQFLNGKFEINPQTKDSGVGVKDNIISWNSL
ncbi:MAG: RNA 3'-terminal phosphate cyclase [Patescibacteria group bacterium]|nr:RNA 3'-terminal phosphate cyclase [Patescibacteria group bacterium]